MASAAPGRGVRSRTLPAGRVRRHRRRERGPEHDGERRRSPTEVAALPNYVGLAGLIKTLPSLLVAVVRAVRDADRIVVHLPGAVGGMAATACRLTGRRYAAEIVGEPVAVLGGEVGGRGGRWLARAIGRHMRWAVRGASHTNYVTREALQRLYPAAPGSVSIGVSDIRLAPEEFVSTAPARVSTPRGS